MATRTPLHRILRSVPEFRGLSKQELDRVIACLESKSYPPGALVWRKGANLDLTAIVQEGSLIAGYRPNRTVRLSSGDLVRLQSSTQGPATASRVWADTATGVTLYIHNLDRGAVARELPDPQATRLRGRTAQNRWRGVWVLLVVILTALLTWRDVAGALSGALYIVSQEFVDRGAHQGALNLLEGAVRLAPGRSLLYNRAGYIGTLIDDDRLAEFAFSRALTADPANGAALSNLAAIRFGDGNTEQALAYLLKASEAAPNAAVVQYNLGIALAAEGRGQQAIRAFKEASRIAPDWSLPHLHQCAAYLQTKDFKQAEAAARAATQLDPMQETANLCLAMALYHQGRPDQALDPIEQALSGTPDDSSGLFYKALILRDLDQPEAALNILERLGRWETEPHRKRRIKAEIEAIRGSVL